jgi:hypothetical protein
MAVIASEAKQSLQLYMVLTSPLFHQIASSFYYDSAEPFGRELRVERLVAGSQ